MRLLIVLLFWTSIASSQTIINSYAYEVVTLNNGLQARLDFDGNTNDAQGNTVTQPEGTAITYISSLNGQAGVFGGDDALQFTDVDLETEAYTVSVIFKRDAGGFQILSELSRQVTNNHKGVNLWSNEVLSNETLIDENPPYIIVDDTNYISSLNTSDGDWYHAIGVYDGTTYSLYFDDSATAAVSGTDASNGLTGDGIVYIGGRPDNSSEFLTGAIDMVAWWNRALTAAEIAQEFANYNSTND